MKEIVSLVHAIFSHAKCTPNKICVVEGGTSFSFKNYWLLIENIASFLKSKGLNNGDRVIVLSSRSIPLTASGLGIQRAGGIFVPLEKNITEFELKKIIAETEARFLLSSGSILETERIECIALDSILSIPQPFSELRESLPFPEMQQVAEILYTTGTTGDRKGVVITHGNVVAVAENIMLGVEMKPGNVELLPVPITHSYGLRSYYASILNGSTTVFMNNIAAMDRFFSEIEKNIVTSLALVPSAIAVILKLSGDKLSQYKNQIDYVQSGSSALDEETKEKLCRLLPKSRLYNFYGSTEAGRSCVLDYSKERGKTSCIGKPAKNASFIILDDDGNPLPPSRENIGTLGCFGNMIMKEYWNDPEGTSRIIKNGFLITSDIAFEENGYIFFVGRKGDIINSGGIKINPLEIEEALADEKSIFESICCGIQDPILGQIPCLGVVMKHGCKISQKDILDHLLKKLSAAKMPRYIFEIKAVPRTFNGKPDRKAAQALFSSKI